MIEQLNLLIEILAIDLVVEVCANQVPSQLIVPVQKREQFEWWQKTKWSTIVVIIRSPSVFVYVII